MYQGLLPCRRHFEKREDPGDEVGLKFARRRVHWALPSYQLTAARSRHFVQKLFKHFSDWLDPWPLSRKPLQVDSNWLSQPESPSETPAKLQKSQAPLDSPFLVLDSNEGIFAMTNLSEGGLLSL